MTVDEERRVAVAEMAVDAVGIAHGDGGDSRAASQHATAGVAYGRARFPLLDGDDDRVERGDGAQHRLRAVVECRDAVEADAEAHHVTLVAGEACDARRVEDMAQYVVGKSLL